jgi:hypothetical protein
VLLKEILMNFSNLESICGYEKCKQREHFLAMVIKKLAVKLLYGIEQTVLLQLKTTRKSSNNNGIKNSKF